MSKPVALALVLAAALVGLGALPSGAETRGIIVTKIVVADQGPRVKLNGAAEFTPLRRGPALIPDGSRIVVPAQAQVEITSNDGEIRTTLHAGTDLTIDSTQSGQRATLRHGNVFFSIVHRAWTFFQIGTGEFNASAEGTEFTVDLSAGKLAFVVSRGAIDVAHNAKLKIPETRRLVRTIRIRSQAGVITGVAVPAPPTVRIIDVVRESFAKSYPLDGSQKVKPFATPSDARDVYVRELERVLADSSASAARKSAAWNNRGIAFAENGELGSAINDYDHAIALDPNDAVAYYNRGSARAQQRRFELAIADYDNAVRLNGGDASSYNNRGIVWAAKGDNRRAIADFNRAIQLNGKDAAALTNRGFEYFATGDDRRAAGDYGEAMALDPRDSFAPNNNAMVRAHNREYDKAIADLGLAIKLDPNNAVAYYNRAEYERLRDPDRAILDFNEAIRIDPRNVLAFNGRGVTRTVKGDTGALSDYNKAISLDSAYGPAYNNRGAAYRLRGDYAAAIRDFTEAIKLEPKIPAAYVSRGLAYAAVGDYARAIADLTAALPLETALPPEAALPLVTRQGLIYGYRGTAYLNAGNPPQAQADFGRAASLVPSNAFIALWREIADRRAKQPSHLAQAETQLDMKVWPAPLVRLFRNEITPAAALAAAGSPVAAIEQGRVCQANFYTAEFMRLRGDEREARRLYEVAARSCPAGYSESIAANAELRRK